MSASSPPRRPSHQRGAALATALLFLIVLTLLGLGALREGRLNLRMAANEEARVNALETAQSWVDALLAELDRNFPVTPQADVQLACYAQGVPALPFACPTSTLTPPQTPGDALGRQTYVEIFRESANGEALVSAASLGTTGTTARVRYARFRVTAGVDRSGAGQGVAEVQQGVQIPIPFVDGLNLF